MKAVSFMLTGAALAAAVSSSRAADPRADLVERGRYLTTAGDCMACHTAKNGQPFAGGLEMSTPFGTIATPNITPDRATGIGNMTDAQFVRVMHQGIGRDGQYLYPAMPFPWYTQVSRDDVLAIKAYLFSLPPVRAPQQKNHLAFPFNIRQTLAAWRVAFFKDGRFEPDAARSAQVNRGAYLVNGLAHCGECHNSRLLAGQSKFQKTLQGGAIDHWYAPNITSDVRDGIGDWSEGELAQYLKTGTSAKRGIAAGPMAEAIRTSLSKLGDDDIVAIAAYLKSEPAKPSSGKPRGERDGADIPGAQAYLNHCASCHGTDGRGIAGVVSALAGNSLVTTKGPQNVVQAVVGGLPAHATYGPMPAVGAGMTDAEIVDVANYVRRQWGNTAIDDATPLMVQTIREKADTPLAAARATGCPAVPPPLAGLLADPQRGIGAALAAADETNMPQQVSSIVAGTRRALPKLAQADVVNGLTAAYCSVVRADATLDWNAKSLRIGHFANLVYAQTNGGVVAARR